ncbi:histone chaperone ASF1-like [Lytechinus variegatus]|uniref:histone chaperone ASF1-like n=1 Tax=Lytechinus variegatus TaxID=7654 RepID=UPI001BB2B35C|nr:histone chaperone ASF1-like [Lytechinus variegatus]
MAKVQVTNVTVLDNPSNFLNPFQFEITFECIENLTEDLEWKIIYVGSAETEDYDQTLDSVLVGPVSQGRHMFVFQANPPDPTKIPQGDILGVTVVLITCSYRDHEFIRVGYYVNNEYSDPELNECNESEKQPVVPQFDKVTRNILHTKPRVTRFTIDWDDPPFTDCENIPPMPPNIQQEQSTSLMNGTKDHMVKAADYAVPNNTDSNSSIPDYVQDMECH